MDRKSLIFWVIVLCMGIVPACSESVSSNENIKWYTYDEGTQTGKKEDKQIFLSFYADWCTFCAKMEKETFKDPAVVKLLNQHFISIRVNTEKEEALARKYFVRGLPMTWFLEPDGEKISSLPGYIPPDMFIQILQFIHSGSYKKMTFKEYVTDLEKSD